MANGRIKDYDKLLNNVRARRTDYDESGNLQKSILTESFKRNDIPQGIKYVFESMLPVGSAYNEKTKEEAERVQNQIQKGLANTDGALKYVSFEYQGSVPLNVHIKLHSDLDIIVIQNHFYHGPSVDNSPVGSYGGSAIEEMAELRNNIFKHLKGAFPAAKVSNDKPKAIQVSGGSLKRKFDILTASWCNNYDYITTLQSYKRGIKLYDKNAHRLLEDYPFKHIHEVDKKDREPLVNGNLRGIVRLLKSLKMDADTEINISSFLITSIMYHMDVNAYNVEITRKQELLANASIHINKILTDINYRNTLKSPDGSEELFPAGYDTSEVKKLKTELDIVIDDIADDFRDKHSSFISGRSLIKGMSTVPMQLNESYDVLKKSPFYYNPY